MGMGLHLRAFGAQELRYYTMRNPVGLNVAKRKLLEGLTSDETKTSGRLIIVFFWKTMTSHENQGLRACLHGGGGPQVGEVTRLGGVTRLSI